jgi:hypothetical protein
MENCYRNSLDVTTCFWRRNNRHKSVLSVFKIPLPICATCPAHLILLDLIIPITFGEPTDVRLGH